MNRTALLAAGTVAVAAVVVLVMQLSLSHRGGLRLNRAEACTVDSDHRKCLPRAEYADAEGKVWTAEDLAGKVVMVNFWATWCKPCLAEVPALATVHRRYEDRGFVLLGVMMDDVGERELARFKSMTGLNYPVVPASQEVVEAYDYPPVLPMTFIYDRHGANRLVHRGPLSEGQLDQVIGRLLEE